MRSPANIPPGITNRMIKEKASGKDDVNNVAYAQAMELTEQEVDNLKHQIVGWIVKRLVAENFSISHLRAIKTIVGYFNNWAYAEPKIFELARSLRAEDKSRSDHESHL